MCCMNNEVIKIYKIIESSFSNETKITVSHLARKRESESIFLSTNVHFIQQCSLQAINTLIYLAKLRVKCFKALCMSS